MLNRRGIVVGLSVIAISAFLAFWFWPRPRVNLLLITLDTTRADRLGCYGHTGAKTPVLDAIAASGVLCERASTVAPLTLPAHTSLLTGLYPAEHGVRSNGRGRLDDSIPTLTEILKERGYDTAAFVASFVLDSKFGLARGFETYDDEITEEHPTAELHHRERDGRLVVDAALDWLGEGRAVPFFCWVHLYDPHAPYLPHKDLFGDEFSDRPYDAEIAYVDSQVGRLMDWLKARQLDSKTLVVVVGDHGEGLGEHLERKHGMTLYDSILHVPLLFRQPGKLAAGKRLSENVSMVDLSPTILELLRYADPRKITGRSIAPGLHGGQVPESACYGATDEPFLNNGWSPLRSLIVGPWKYIRTTRPELYNLQDDPGERHDLASSNVEQTRTMELRMVEFESRLAPPAESSIQLRPDERKALESLGYLGGPRKAELHDPGPVLPDIKEMLPTEAAVEEAGDLISRGEVDAGIELLKKVAEQVPGHSKAHCYLADALRDRKRYEEAVDVLQKLLAKKPDAAEAHYGLAVVRLAEGRDDDAMAALKATLALDADYAEAHYDLAMIHLRRGETTEALAEFDAVLEIDHCHGAAYTERGTLLVKLGRVPAGVADYRRALKFTPNAPSLHNNLGVVLSQLGAKDEALVHLERAVELSPEAAEFQYTLGDFLASQGRLEEAESHLARAVELKPGFRVAEERLGEMQRALGKSPSRAVRARLR